MTHRAIGRARSIWRAAAVAVLTAAGSLVGGGAGAVTPGAPVTPDAPVAQPRPVQFYVAPWGADSWPGTAARPFATPARAQRAVRAVTARMTADVVVNLRGGTYRLAEPLRLSDAAGDSGRNGHRVVYQAYGYGTAAREAVTLTGGRAVTGWRPAAELPGAWRADAGALETRQLYVGGRRAGAARRGPLPGRLIRTRTGYLTDSTAPQSWLRPQDIELVYNGAAGELGFSEARCGVRSIAGNARRTVITMDQPCHASLAQVYQSEAPHAPEPIDPTSVENSLSFLRAPGTWYLDRSRPGRHLVYYRPRPGEDPRRVPVVAPVLESLLDGAGNDAAAPLHDLAIRGLTFTHATWLAPSAPAGFAHIFGAWYFDAGSATGPTFGYLQMPGAVAFRNVRRVSVEGSRFAQLGGQALAVSELGSSVLVRDNVVEDVSGGGISLNVDVESRSNRVEDNRLRQIGREYGGGIGISVEGGAATTVRHNDVQDVAYSGIVVVGPEVVGPLPGRILIEANRVVHSMRALSDGGGIYTNGPLGVTFSGGAVIRGNVVHDTGGARTPPGGFVPIAVYTDLGADGITVERNVLYRNNHSYGGVEPRTLRFAGNFWDDDRPSWWPEDTPTGGISLAGNTLLPRDDPARACAALPVCAAVAARAGRS